MAGRRQADEQRAAPARCRHKELRSEIRYLLLAIT
jgi:hypothetical protein